MSVQTQPSKQAPSTPAGVPAANGISRYVLQTASGRTSRSMSLVK